MPNISPSQDAVWVRQLAAECADRRSSRLLAASWGAEGTYEQSLPRAISWTQLEHRAVEPPLDLLSDFSVKASEQNEGKPAESRATSP